MKESVRANFLPFTIPLEGVVRWLYLDVKGLVTIGIGNLVDPVWTALWLRMVHKDTGAPASPAEIRDEWERVKAHPTAARQGHRVLEAATSLRLTDEGLELVVENRLTLNDSILRVRFPDFDAWPADAQLAAHSMAWACGPGFPRLFPRLAAALGEQAWEVAANECQMDTRGNPGIVDRNHANRALFFAAAHGFDPDEVTWAALSSITHEKWPERPRPDQLLEDATTVTNLTESLEALKPTDR